MVRLANGAQRSAPGRALCVAAIAAVLQLGFWPRTAEALLVNNVTDAGTISLRSEGLGAGGGGAPVFGVDVLPGTLIDPGGGFDALTGVVQAPAAGAAGSIAPFPLGAASPPLATHADFGSGAMAIQAVAGPFGGGVFFSGNVFDTPIDNKASVVSGQGVATLFEPVGVFIGVGGAILSVGGFVNDPLNQGAFVAAGLSGTIGGIAFDPITIRFDGVGGNADGVFFNAANAGTNLDFFGFGTINFGGGFETFRAVGISLIDADSNAVNGLTSFAVGLGGVVIDVTLTLLADPDSGLSLIEIPLDLLAPGTQLPQFGSVAAALPEPEGFLLLAGGLLAFAWMTRRRRAG